MNSLDKRAFFKAINYQPHSSGQWAYHNSSSRFRVAVCGRRYGKSTMAGRDLEPELFTKEKKRFWIVGPVYSLAEKEFRVVWDDLIIGRELGRDKRVKRAYNLRTGEMYIEFPWGTRLEAKSAQHPEQLVGESLDGVIMSEAAKHNLETWERFIMPSLADKRGWATFPTTPEGHNWLYNVWQFGQDPSFTEYQSWRFPSWENPIVYPEGRDDPEILLMERTQTPEWFMQEVGADFASFVGKIYPEFDETVHVRPHTYRPDWSNYMGFDFGYTAPLAAIEFQVDPWDNIYVWREHYQANRDLRDHLHLLQQREQPNGYKIDLTFGDAADPEAVAVINAEFAPCVADPLSKSNWRQGVDLVRRFLKLNQTGEADEYGTPKLEPRLWIDNSCRNTIREFNNYRVKENSVAPRENTATGAAQKGDDHALDAIRYALVHLYELSATSTLRDTMPMSLTGQLHPIDSVPEHGYFSDMERVF